jgi:type II secretory pathway component PulF
MNPPPTLSYDRANRSMEQWKLFAFYLVLHLIISCTFIGYTLFFIPYFAGVFRDFRATMPALSEWIISLSDFAASHWYGWITVVALNSAWSMLIANLHVRSEENRWGRRFLLAALFLFYLAAFLTVLTAIMLPFLRLFTSVSGST